MRTSGFTRTELGLVAAAAVLVFSRVFAFSLVLPGFRGFGATLTDSPLLVGVALGAYGLTMAVAQLANGWLSDHVGRRPVLLLGSAVFVAGSAWAAMAESIGALVAARLLQGLGGVASVAMAAVGETVHAERRTVAMALVGVPAGLGFFLGFALGPAGEELVGFRGLFWTTAALGAAAALPLLLRGLPPPLPPEPAAEARRGGVGAVGRGGGVGAAVAVLAAAGFTANLAMTAVAFHLPDVGTVGLAVALAGALAVMAVASRALDRSGRVAAPIAAALVVLAAGAAVFTAGTPWPATVAGGLAFFAAHATLSAALPSQVSRLAGRSGGRGHGVQLVVAYLGSAAGGALAGAFAEWDGLTVGGARLAGPVSATFAVVAAVAVAVAVAALARLPASTRSPLGSSRGPPGPPTGPPPES